MPQTRYIACHIRKIVLVIATLCEGLRATPPPPSPVKMLTISSLILLHFRGRFLPVCWQVLMGKRWGFRREEVYLEGTMLISRERNVFRGNEMYFEGTKYISRERNIFGRIETCPFRGSVCLQAIVGYCNGHYIRTTPKMTCNGTRFNIVVVEGSYLEYLHMNGPFIHSVVLLQITKFIFYLLGPHWRKG